MRTLETVATLLLQGHSANQNAGTTKMLPPSGEEGCSPSENTTCNRSNENAGFPDTTKLHVEENAGFLDTKKTHVIKAQHNADKALLVSLFSVYSLSPISLVMHDVIVG